MKDLLLAIASTSLVAGGICLLAPEGRLKRQTVFLTSLVLCLALLAPLRQLLGRDPFEGMALPILPSEIGGEAQEAFVAMTGEALCRAWEEALGERFALEGHRLSLTLDAGDPSAVTVVSGTLTGRGEVDKAAAYLSERLGCPVTTVMEKEETEDGSVS